ncbi:hypothetical protein M9H77_25330 [Catharanthus roseus]|uniref:Uncharacterized protein n=1 Tax=Catharanthus roseus TaxID=4058 RepID=A0ACC0A998_CATRO|nr:hypothetical protein M9H77_25330 [Catharanthus roseus]
MKSGERGEAGSLNLEILQDVPHNQEELAQSSSAQLHQEQSLVASAVGHEEQLLAKAKTLTDEKVKRKSSVKKSSKRRSSLEDVPQNQGEELAQSSTEELPQEVSEASDSRSSDDSSDVEVISKEYVPFDQRMVIPKSRAAKRLQNIVIEQTPVSSAGHDHSKDANQNQGTHKDIGAPSKSNSASASEDEEIYYNDLLLSRQSEFGGETDNCGSKGDERQNRERDVEIDGTSLCPSESSSKENNSESDSDDLSYDKDNLDESTNKHDGSSSSGKVLADENRLECKETDAVDKKRKAVNDHEESGQKKKVLGLHILVDDTKRDEVSKSLPEQLRPRQVSESTKKTLESGKLSCPMKVFESDSGDELGDANDTDHIVLKRSGENSTTVWKKSMRKNCVSKNIDYMEILSDSIWDKSDALKEKLPPCIEKSPGEKTLPLKFRFEDDEPAPPEKDEEQIEADHLFTDLEKWWTEDNVGGTKLSKEDRNENAANETNPVESCELGNHFFILDEEIGVVCEYCGVVQQEMKYVLADLKIPNWIRHERFDYHSDDHHRIIDDEGPVLNLIPEAFRRQMYPHQLDGFQFLWKNIGGATLIEDIKTPLPEGGSGCIISHAPGTGKTYLTIVFLLTFMKVHPMCHPMIIAPPTMLHSWADEIKRWKIDIPFHNLNDPDLSGEENVIASSIIQPVWSSMKDKRRERDYRRMVKLYSWTKDRSILGIGYNLFKQLADDLKAIMDPFVHVHKGAILQESLPGLSDKLVILTPTDLQKKLLEMISDNVFEKVRLVSLISTQPSLVAEQEKFSDHKSILEELKISPEAGVKTKFVIELVRLCSAQGEKVLIFSEYIDPLNFLKKQLTSHFSWEEGMQVLYLDRKLDEKQHRVVIHSFNDHNSEAKVLLASTKAYFEGINLVGASRVVLLDVVWNPSVERQAINRAYRLGQKKFVHVYHLLMSGTMEVEKYQRQSKKDKISELVFSSPYERKYEKSKISYDNILEAMVNHRELHHIFEKVLHQPNESNFPLLSFTLVKATDSGPLLQQHRAAVGEDFVVSLCKVSGGFIDTKLMFYFTTDMQEDRNEVASTLQIQRTVVSWEIMFLILYEKIGVVQQEIKTRFSRFNEIKRRKIDISLSQSESPDLSGEENAIASNIIQRVQSSMKDKVKIKITDI